MWIPYVSREPAWNPHGIHMDSRRILAVFWGSENQPRIQGIHVESLFIPWIPHGIHKECVGGVKSSSVHHIRATSHKSDDDREEEEESN